MPSGSRRPLRGPDAQLTHLPPGGFGAVRRRDPAVALLRRHQREDLGLCPYCGSSADGDTIACIPCLAVAAAARRRLKAGRRAQGLCPCGAHPAPGFKLCSKCLGHARSGVPPTALAACASAARRRRPATGPASVVASARPPTVLDSGPPASACAAPAPARPGRCLCARCGAAAVVASSCCSGSRRSGLNERRKRDPGRRRDREPLRPSG